MITRKRSSPRRGPVEDPKYLSWIRTLPCVCCARWKAVEDHPQRTPTEAAHVGVRGLGQKCSDREAIPLCGTHHRTGLLAQHALGRKFWSYHGLDREQLIAEYQERYETAGD